ncbi:MAG: transcription factor TFIIIC subunit tfc4 [Piccolia ochrophora]|nr:MAG: transcription factor TFIIIC subunit tfc4 [Piccolia ochrophora]
MNGPVEIMDEGDDLDLAETATYDYPDIESQPAYPWLGQSATRKEHDPTDHETDYGIETTENSGTSDDDPIISEGPSTSQNKGSFRPTKRARVTFQSITDPPSETYGSGLPRGDADKSAEGRSGDESSDTDEEFYTLHEDVDRFQQSLRVAGKKDGERRYSVDDPQWKKGGRRGRRGPAKQAEPSLEIKLLLSKANDAFINKDYDLVEEIATNVIQMNPETYAAHTLLSGVFLERGEIQLGVVAQMSAAHLRPRNTGLWRRCVDLIMENAAEIRASYLNDAIYCCSRILKVDSKDFEARYQRASLLRELGHAKRAASELEQMLGMVPNDINVLRPLAEVYIDIGEVDKAEAHYRNRIAAAWKADGPPDDTLSWSDVNIFVELFGLQGQYLQGVEELRRLSRWFLGRRAEAYWDDIRDDDREWDAGDEPRRNAIPTFVPGLFPPSTYGDGLPLELRVKLGLYRLKLGQQTEALDHFAWLEPLDDGPEAKLFDYQDLFREAADGLLDVGNSAEALKFYEPLQQIDEYPDPEFYSQLGKAYRMAGLPLEAEQSYKIIIENDAKNVDARVQLAKVYEELNMPEKAFSYVSEVLLLRQDEPEIPRRGRKASLMRKGSRQKAQKKMPRKVKRATPREWSVKQKSAEEIKQERLAQKRAQFEATRMHFGILQGLEDQMRRGDSEAARKWMEIAALMIHDFRSCKVFFPFDKYVKFLGYSVEARKRALRPVKHSKLEEVDAMADRLHASLEQEHGAEVARDPAVPRDYRGIDFDHWLDIFLEYAVNIAKRGQRKQAYEIVQAASDCNVWYHSQQSSFLIYTCWVSCAVYGDDDETACIAARWFMKEYQFTSDSYRLFAALNRLCSCQGSWYNSGPSQKFMLRQIKAMDFTLVPEELQNKLYEERASYSSKDSKGQVYVNDEMDVSLLMLYGHMLYFGASYPPALNYFFRAFALDPGNPMINFSIALSYIQYGLKRQSENRQFLIMQGFGYLFAYYEARKKSASVQQVQEAEFNVARTFHQLGLTHLALPYYEKVLALSEALQTSNPDPKTEDFGKEAAFNCQAIYAMSGNMDMARKVTEKYLVL